MLRTIWSKLLMFAAVAAPCSAAAGSPRPMPPSWRDCRDAIAAVEPDSGIPPGLLLGIALIETGRPMPGGGASEPWPWSYNVEGESHFAATKEDAMAEVASLRSRGVASIDIGCMQINLKYHPDAFGNLDRGFDALGNVRYAASFLRDLRAREGNWADAIALYHSGDPGRGVAYHRRVLLARLGARLGQGGAVALPAATTAGLCSPGRSAVLVLRGLRPRMVCRR
jgi:hypothetical protein